MIFYTFKPVDTLVFRGVEHTSTFIFPPSSYTISGAIRTEYLKQHNIDFKDYGKGKVDNKIIEEIGQAGEKAPFSIIGPIFKKENNFFIPAPYSWYIEKNDNEKNEQKKDFQINSIIKSKKIENPLIINNKKLFWAKGKKELQSIGGKWIKLNDLNNKKELEIFNLSFFVSFETRTGTAINHKTKTVEQGNLYTFTHARLKENIEIVFGLTKEIDLENSGILKLGAEQRFGKYEKIENPLKEQSGNLFLSLSIVEGTKEANQAVVATGKINYSGGWDLKKKFHKPMKGYFPAGTVFSKKLNNNFISF